MSYRQERMVCPKCGGTSNLGKNESVLCTTPIEVNPDGTWYWSDREIKIHWETSQASEGEAEWWCGDCNIAFDLPGATSQESAEDCRYDSGELIEENPNA